jgi:formate dehydrogenase
MFNMAGNPLLSCAGSERLATAFEDLELFVCMDIVRNETAEYADYVLPGLHALERADIPFYFFTMMGLMPTRSFTYTDAVLEPPGEARDEGLVYRQLCRAAGKPIAGSRLLQWVSNISEGLRKVPLLGGISSMDKLFLSLLTRSAKLGGLGKLRKSPDGLLLEPNQPGDFLGQRVFTPSGKVELAPDDLVKRAQTLEQIYEDELANAGALKLIQKRERFTHNSWAHNSEPFVKGERNTNYLYIHPEDARSRQLVDGSTARISVRDKHIEAPVRLDEDMLPGTISVPHGWGHQQATGLSVANKTLGVNVNILIPDGPDSIEPASGMSHMNGVIAQVSAVEQTPL